MADNPFGVLTPFQRRILDLLAAEPLLKDFYLTGGTALSAFYLGHRLSEDLDFFTEAPQAVARIPAMINAFADRAGLRVTLGRRFQTLFECRLSDSHDESIEMDFALDMPGRLSPIVKMPGSTIGMDNPLDICCNKLSALYERSEPKDYVDLYFIHDGMRPLHEVIQHARKKYPGLDDYGLAMAFFKVKDLAHWPRMLKPFDPKVVRNFFLAEARKLADGFDG
jgi:hypothetical protein